MAAMLWLASAALPAAAGCLPLEGDRVLARDLARLAPEFASVAPEEVAGLAPSFGARRVFEPPELARLARRWGVAIEKPAVICFERVTRILTGDAVRAALRQSLGIPEAKVELADFSRLPVPAGRLEFPRSGLAVPAIGRADEVLWRGRVVAEGGRSVPVWARVRMSVRRPRPVARVPLAAGRAVEMDQVVLEEREEFPLPAPDGFTLEQVAGRRPRRAIPAGQAILPAALMPVREVEAGQTVAVEVTSGAARLSFEGKAETAGRAGDAIVVRNPASGRKFRAVVEGKGRAAVQAGPRGS